MAWTFICPTEIIAFSNATSQFSGRGAQVVICSTDSEYSLLAWRSAAQKDGGLGPVDVPLLSDKNHQISRDYGVLIEEEGIALRGMFLIDPQGILRQVRLDSVIATNSSRCNDSLPIDNSARHRVRYISGKFVKNQSPGTPHLGVDSSRSCCCTVFPNTCTMN